MLVKAVAVIEASADTVFDVILSLERHHRYEYDASTHSLNSFSLVPCYHSLFMILCRWDTFSGDLELVDSYDGHYDVVYGKFDPRYLTR